MRKAAAAEWVLSLVCEPVQACAVTGDLLEQGSSRGALWLWFSVLQIASSHVFQDVRAARVRMLWLGFLGVLEFSVIGIFAANGLMKLWQMCWPYGWGPDIPHWGYYAVPIAAVITIAFFVGWDLARRSEGRELAAGFAFTCMLAAVSALIALVAVDPVHHVHRPLDVATLISWLKTIATGMPGFPGAIFYRRHSVRRRFGAA